MDATRYDALLVAIPATILLGVTASTAQMVSFQQGLAAGGVVSTLLLYEALFRHPPIEPTPTDVAACSLVTANWLAVGLVTL